MLKRLSIGSILYFAFVFFLASVQPAHAYLDPGSGSFAIQFLLAGGLGTLYFLRSYFGKVKNFLLKILHIKSENSQTNTRNGK